MMFPWFDKNAIKECRCSCCNSGPLDITHPHMHTNTSLWFLSDCAIIALKATLSVVLAVSQTT